PRPVALRVDDDRLQPHLALAAAVRDLLHQELQRLERLPLLTDDEPGLAPLHVQDDALRVLGELDAAVDAHALEHPAQNLTRARAVLRASSPAPTLALARRPPASARHRSCSCRSGGSCPGPCS